MPAQGFEPATLGLGGERSTNWANPADAVCLFLYPYIRQALHSPPPYFPRKITHSSLDPGTGSHSWHHEVNLWGENLCQRRYQTSDPGIRRRALYQLSYQVWNPFLKRQSVSLERVQRRATKLVKHISHLSYENRLKKLKLPSLKYRRIRGDLINT